MPAPSVSFYTLGCRLNQAETALLCDLFQRAGYSVRSFGEPTEVCVINSCSVTSPSEARCRNIIRNILRNRPDTFLIVVGCYAQVGAEALSEISGVDLIVGTDQKFDLPGCLQAIREQTSDQTLPKQAQPLVVRSEQLPPPAAFTIPAVGRFLKHTRANIKIQDGCNFFCSYCIVPYARGRDRSREIEDIRREARALAQRGHRELVITGVNIGAYADQGKNLLDVLKMLEDIEGVERIRITSIEPMTIPDGMIDYVAASCKLCHFFHIPLQSGANRILERMNRRYTREDFADFVGRLARRVPDAGIGTDLIVGFPGEGEAEFEQSRQLLADLPLMYAHVFSFSPRAGTPAARFADQVHSETITRRSQILRTLSAEKRRQFYTRAIDRTVSVLFEQREKSGLFTGHTGNYMKVGVSTDEQLANCVREVVITDVADTNLVRGRLVV